MRALALTSLLSLAGCLVYAQPEPTYVPPPPESGPMPERGGAPPPPRATPPAPAERSLDRDAAVAAAFRIARDRGLVVDRVTRAELDGEGRWRVELRGAFDRARLVLDARDGRLLKGKFRAKAGRPRQP